MTRGIISKFIVVLIVLFTAQSVFWFFKTSGVKKHTLAMIAASNGKIGAASVSVSGFPISQKLKIENLKFEVSSLPGGAQLPNKYQINIKDFEAVASIFSNDFKVTAIQDVTFQDKDGVSNNVEFFNQVPNASLSFAGGMLSKFSYQDSGYKIVDLSKNVLFQNGSSNVNFEAVADGNKFRHKVKADFKDISIFSSTPPAVAASDIAPASNPAASSADASAPAAQPVAAPATSDANSGLIKKNISLEMEYVLAPASAAPASPADIAESVVDDSLQLESLNIKNFEISSPLYKVNLNGNITAFKKDSFPIGSVSARVEKLDNVLIYLKKYLPDGTQPAAANVVDPAAVASDGTAQPVVDIKAASMPSSDSATTLASNQKPIDIAAVVKDLSKKNVATNDDIAVFDFRQEANKDLVINETPLPEIMSQFFTSSINSGTSAPASAPASANAPAAIATPAVNVAAPVAHVPAAAPASAPVADKSFATSSGKKVAAPAPASAPAAPVAPVAPATPAPASTTPAAQPAAKANNAN